MNNNHTQILVIFKTLEKWIWRRANKISTKAELVDNVSESNESSTTKVMSNAPPALINKRKLLCWKIGSRGNVQLLDILLNSWKIKSFSNTHRKIDKWIFVKKKGIKSMKGTDIQFPIFFPKQCKLNKKV